MKKNRLCVLSIAMSLFFTCSARNFENNWRTMQREYIELINVLDENGFLSRVDAYLHPYWNYTHGKIKNLILDEPDEWFLFDEDMQRAMVRLGSGIAQSYEACYLNHLLDSHLSCKIHAYKDTDFGYLPYDCKDFKCSVNTLGHLYYAARVLDNSSNDIQTVVEFGAGYGNLARVFAGLIPESTIILIDLPELLAIQYLFLTSTTDKKVIMHKHVPTVFEKDAVHLVPTYFIPELALDEADLFISTFALSEAPQSVQELVVGKNFFGASMSYIVGQLNGWSKELSFVDHRYLVNQARAVYQGVHLAPYHTLLIGLESYEMIAKNDN